MLEPHTRLVHLREPFMKTLTPRFFLAVALIAFANLGFVSSSDSQQAADPNPSFALPFREIVIFGDSLSDVGNIAHRTNEKFYITYPGPIGNYATGRFTNSAYTYPRAKEHEGVWHEQLQES